MCFDFMFGELCGVHGQCLNNTNQTETERQLGLLTHCVCDPNWLQSTEFVFFMNPTLVHLSKKVLVSNRSLVDLLEELEGEPLSASDLEVFAKQLPCTLDKSLLGALNGLATLSYLMCLFLLLCTSRYKKGLRKHFPSLAAFLFMSIFFATRSVLETRNLGEDIFMTTFGSLAMAINHFVFVLMIVKLVSYHKKKLQGSDVFSKEVLEELSRRMKYVQLISGFGSLLFIICYVTASYGFSMEEGNQFSLQAFTGLEFTVHLIGFIVVANFAWNGRKVLLLMISSMKNVNAVIAETTVKRMETSVDKNPFSFANKLEATRQTAYQVHCAKAVPALKRINLFLLIALAGFSLSFLLPTLFPYVQQFGKYFYSVQYIICALCFSLTFKSIKSANKRKTFNPLKYLRRKKSTVNSSFSSMKHEASISGSEGPGKNRMTGIGRSSSMILKYVSQNTEGAESTSLKTTFRESMNHLQREATDETNKSEQKDLVSHYL